MKVLLVAPIDPKIPGNLSNLMGGESTYTSNLLRNPPRGVVYGYYLDAIAKNQIERVNPWWNIVLNMFIKLRILPVSPGTIILKTKGRYDLVHCHSYSVKIIDDDVPVLVSDSSSNYIYLKDYLNWSILRIKFAYFLKEAQFKFFGILDCEVNYQNIAKVIVFSDFSKKAHLNLGVPKNKIEVINPGIESLQHKRKPFKRTSLNILFVGIWFERKGGHLFLEAYRQLSRKYPNLKLTVVGPIPKKYRTDDLRLKNYKFVPRSRLMRNFFPKADIFVLAPPKVEGFGFVVLEAMAFGIPTVVSRVCALPELVCDGETGFIVKPGSIPDLVQKLEKLIVDHQLRKKMGVAGRARFLKEFSADVMNKKLARVYKGAVENF